MTPGQRIAQKRKELGLSRYHAAQPEPHKSVWDKWSVRVLFALFGIMLALLVGTNSKVKEMDRQYSGLLRSIENITDSVDSRISAATRRMEETLEEQASLTAEWSADPVSTDLRANTVTFQIRVVPRTYVEGMEAEFLLVSGGESFTVPGELGEDHAFTARTTVPLTDEIAVSVAFLNGDQRQTQVLEEFHSLYSDSFATIRVTGGLSRFTKSSEAANWTAVFSPVHVDCLDKYGDAAQVSSLRVGLFRDQKLVAWFTEEEQSGREGYHVFRMEPDRMEMGSDGTYCIAAVVEDEFGREWVEFDLHSAARFAIGEKDRAPDVDYSRDPADWEF